MKNKEFDDVVNETVEATALLLKRKGLEYSNEVDRLSAFKDIAKEAGVTSKQALLVLKSKHTGAISKYIRNDAKGLQQILNEPIEQRIYDDINYLILLLALLKEEQTAKQPKIKVNFDFDALDAVNDTLKDELNKKLKPLSKSITFIDKTSGYPIKSWGLDNLESD